MKINQKNLDTHLPSPKIPLTLNGFCYIFHFGFKSLMKPSLFFTNYNSLSINHFKPIITYTTLILSELPN